MSMWLFFTVQLRLSGRAVYTSYKSSSLRSVLGGTLLTGCRIADISAMLSATLLGYSKLSYPLDGLVVSHAPWVFFLLGGLFTRYKYDFKKAHG